MASVTQNPDNTPVIPKKEERIEENPAVQKPKPTGKLDFSKAKPKVKAEESIVKVKTEKVDTPIDKVGKKTSLKPGISKSSNFFSLKPSNKKVKEDSPAHKVQIKKEASPDVELPTKVKS
jgi:hypothetical protein